MRIVGGLDIHRAQITFDYADLRTGEEVRGVIRPATREAVRAFVATLGRTRGAFAMEATTGWRFVTDELVAAGFEAHVAEPADTRALAGPKRRAKTDRADARLQRELPLKHQEIAKGQEHRVADVEILGPADAELAGRRAPDQEGDQITVTVEPAFGHRDQRARKRQFLRHEDQRLEPFIIRKFFRGRRQRH